MTCSLCLAGRHIKCRDPEGTCDCSECFPARYREKQVALFPSRVGRVPHRAQNRLALRQLKGSPEHHSMRVPSVSVTRRARVTGDDLFVQDVERLNERRRQLHLQGDQLG